VGSKVWSVECGMERVERGVKVRSAECKERSGECVCGVQGVRCVECGL